VLDGHLQGGTRSVIGVVDSARVEGNEIIATLRLSARADVADIVRDIGDGILRNLSVGYSVSKWRDGTDPSTKRRTRTATAFRISEVSFVAVPADPGAKTRSITVPKVIIHDDDPAERTTINKQIRELAARAGVTSTVTDDLIDRSASIEDARSAILDDIVQRGSVSIRSGGRHNAESLDNPEVFQRMAAEALYTRILPSFQPSPQARAYVGMTTVDMARECLHRAGISTQGLSPPTLVTRALQSSSDYPSLLANVMNKSLRDAYQISPSGIRQIARETTSNDFRAKSRIQFDHTGFTLENVPETGEFRMGGFIDTAESYAVDSYGKVFAISRKALVNDDLGAFGDVTRRMGMAAAEFERQFLVNLLVMASGLGPSMSDGLTLFHTSHGNNAAAGGVPSQTTLSDARLAMRSQTGPGGGLISVTPKFLVVPSALETTAEKMLTSIQPVVTDDVNVFDFLELVVEPRLISATRWYLCSDPALLPCLEFAYLAGAPGPQTETEVGFMVDGVRIKVRLDYGAGFIEWRGIYSNIGA
jgi:hypothetical protein